MNGGNGRVSRGLSRDWLQKGRRLLSLLSLIRPKPCPSPPLCVRVCRCIAEGSIRGRGATESRAEGGKRGAPGAGACTGAGGWRPGARRAEGERGRGYPESPGQKSLGPAAGAATKMRGGQEGGGQGREQGRRGRGGSGRRPFRNRSSPVARSTPVRIHLRSTTTSSIDIRSTKPSQGRPTLPFGRRPTTKSDFF